MKNERRREKRGREKAVDLDRNVVNCISACRIGVILRGKEGIKLHETAS